jgi:hypothetical protein
VRPPDGLQRLGDSAQAEGKDENSTQTTNRTRCHGVENSLEGIVLFGVICIERSEIV